MESSTFIRAREGCRARSAHRHARLRRQRGRAHGGLRRLRRAARSPATSSAPSSPSASARMPRPARCEVLEPSPERIEPLADHPGAPWQVLPYERQLADQARAGPGRADADRPSRGLPARLRSSRPSSSGAIATSSSTPSVPRADGTLICGFHAPGSWHDIVAIDDCLLASERSNAAREQVLAWCRAQGHVAFDRRTHTGLLRNLVVREGRRTGQLQVRLVTGPGEIDGDEPRRGRRLRRAVVDDDGRPGRDDAGR